MIQSIRRNEFLQRYNRVAYANEQQLIKSKSMITSYKKLHIVYALTHVGVCGGVKIIFEHANQLLLHGALVTLVSHFPKPDWFPIKANYIQVPFTIELAKGIPPCDIIVATYWDHIQSCIETGLAPVVYFEQGDSHLFNHNSMEEDKLEFVRKQFSLPKFIITVSHQAARLIAEIYGRESTVFHNAIDQNIFFSETSESNQIPDKYILMVGSGNIDFKGIPDIIKAFESLKEQFPSMALYWVSPDQPHPELVNKVTTVFINPDQQKIAELYRGAFVYVSASHYESFSLPVLEAMCCGCPVVTTKNQGVIEYARDGYNCLFIKSQSPSDIVDKVSLLLNCPDLKTRLVQNGCLTADQFNWKRIIPNLLRYYSNLANYGVVPLNSTEEWDLKVSPEQFVSSDKYLIFINFLKNSQADIVKVPIIYYVLENQKLAVWEVGAQRLIKNNTISEEYCYSEVIGTIYHPAEYEFAYNLFINRKFEESLHCFIQHFRQENDSIKKLVYMRWIIMCLIELKRDIDAMELLQSTLQNTIDNADLYYLEYILCILNNKQEELSNLYRTVTMLGDAACYPEFFYGVLDRMHNNL